jgi:uncharacterized protein (TIGR03437 family)
VHLPWPALAILLCSVARGQAPAYSAAGIVNASNSAAGPFAPNSILSLYGANLSYAPGPVTAQEQPGFPLPTSLGGVSVYVSDIPAPLLYVSASQINFLIPMDLLPGTKSVRVVRQGTTGPEAPIAVISAAPALFAMSGYALAADWNAGGAVITPDAPAHPGDVIILYATGLGKPAPGPGAADVPTTANPILAVSDLKVTLAGVPLDSASVKYAGVTPGWAGLYQINLVLPDKLPPDPEIIVSIANQASLAGLKLAVR